MSTIELKAFAHLLSQVNSFRSFPRDFELAIVYTHRMIKLIKVIITHRFITAYHTFTCKKFH